MYRVFEIILILSTVACKVTTSFHHLAMCSYVYKMTKTQELRLQPKQLMVLLTKSTTASRAIELSKHPTEPSRPADMIESLLQSGIGGLLYPSSSSIALYTVSAVVLSLILAFLAISAYLHYIHWRYSHIPQPKRPR